MANFKNTPYLSQKLASLVETLNEATKSPFKNNAFFSNLSEVGTILDSIQKQVDKYLKTNAIKRGMIASDIRHKLKNLEYSLSFQIRLLDSIYVSPPVMLVGDADGNRAF